MDRLGLYVHIPFCPQRCPYCAFAVETGKMDQVDRYVAAVCLELEASSVLTPFGNPGVLDTVFFGGGTPSRISPRLIGRILQTADRVYGLSATAEITLEANPTTAEARHFSELRQVGINRLSIGVQSLQDETLRLLGRTHDAQEAIDAFQLARRTGFESVNTDLIFSVPGEPTERLEATLTAMVDLAPDHISAYTLTVEEGTPFATRRTRGELPHVDEDEDAEAFLRVRQHLQAAGYEHYEISNYGRPSHRCRHNWDCWTGGGYLGVGLSAHSFVPGERWWNTSDLLSYCDRVEGGTAPREGTESIGPQKKLEEQIWLGLRTCEGTRITPAQQASVLASVPLRTLMASHQLSLIDGRLRLTDEGFAIADAVVACVLDALGTHSPKMMAAANTDDCAVGRMVAP